MHNIKRETIYLYFIILIIFCVFQYGIQKICGFTVYPDEFGYWASAAKTIGYDWTGIASLGSYYSFGYSLVLIPILKLFAGGVSAYRAAVTVNMAFMCVSVLLLWKMSGRLFAETDEVKRIFISGIAVFYPPWIFYMQMTLAESLLVFLFIAIAWLFVCFIQRSKPVTMVFLVLMLMYAYCVHMRTIGIIIACLVTLLLWGLSNPAMRKQMFLLLGMIAAAGLIVMAAKKNVIAAVFSGADAEMLAINDYSSQLWKIRNILSPAGFFTFIREIVAKFFYLGMASFGIFYWALVWCTQETVELAKNIIRKRADICTVQQWTALFLLLSVIGQVLICSIYMHGSDSIDCLVYGRYNEFLAPVLITLGVAAMLKSKKTVQGTLIMGILSGIMLILILSVIEDQKLERIRGYFIVGISFLLKEDDFNPYYFFRNTWILGLALMLLTAGIIWIIKKWKNTVWLLGVIMAMEIFAGIQASAHYTYKLSEAGFRDLVITDKILENWSLNADVAYLNEGNPVFVDFLQMQIPDIPVRVIESEDAGWKDELPEFLITFYNTGKKKELEGIYGTSIMSNTYILYFNPKGDKEYGETKESIDYADFHSLFFWIV